MASASRAFICLATVAVLVQAALGADYAVGGAGGWSLGTNMQAWASAQSFEAGGTLTFSYVSPHTVVEVSKGDYDSCSASNPINAFTDGNSVINLTSPGKRYFICGTASHCSSGMKVEIDTVSAAAVPTPPPAVSPAPPLVAPPADSPTKSSKAPSASPSGVPLSAPSAGDSKSPASAPSMTPSVAPASDLPVVPPTPLPSAANPLTKIGTGMVTGMMLALLL